MATRSHSTVTLRSKIEEDHLTCTICMENFTKPKALPCLHTFCEGCLRDFVVGRGYETEGKFPCPVCRMETVIPNGDVSNFPDNHWVNSLLDTMRDSRRVPKLPPRPPKSPADRNTNAPVAIAVNTKTNSTVPIYPDLTEMTSPSNNNDVIPQQQTSPVLACSHGMTLRFGKYGPGLVDFFKPCGLAISRTGDIIVADEGGNRILIFLSCGQLKTKFACKSVIKDVTVTPNNDILVSVDNSGSTIMHLYDMNGKCLSEIGQHYRYEHAGGITCLRNGQIAVTGLETLCVYIFNSQYQYSGTTIGRKGSGDGRFLCPCHVTSNSKSHVIICDSVNHNVQVFTTTGKFKFRFGGEGSNHSYLNSPQGVACDNKDNIVVADSNNYRVEVFSSKGRYLGTLVKHTYDIGHEVKPVKVAVTSNNQYLVLLVGPGFAEVRAYVPRVGQLGSVDTPDGCKPQ